MVFYGCFSITYSLVPFQVNIFSLLNLNTFDQESFALTSCFFNFHDYEQNFDQTNQIHCFTVIFLFFTQQRDRVISAILSEVHEFKLQKSDIQY